MNKREKIMVTVLLVVAVLYLFNQFLLTPSLDSFNQLKQKRDSLSAKTKLIQTKAEKIKGKKEETELLEEELSKLSTSFFQSYEIEDIGTVIDELVKKNNINVDSYSPSITAIKELSSEEKEKVQEISTLEEAYNRMEGKEGKAPESSTKKKKEEGIISAPEYEITMTFEGRYVDIMKFVSDIENYEKKISLKSFQLNSGKGDELGMSGSITISTFILPLERKINEGVFEKEGRRDNPFAMLKDDGEKINLVSKKADLFLLLKPTSSDQSSMIMGMNDSEKNNDIKLDSDNIEECVIHIKEENSRLMIRYSIGDVSYPKDGFREIRVNNDDEIILEVTSAERNDNDQNGVEVKINNDSSYSFIYRVGGDDDDDPRFKLVEKKGSVRGE